MNKSYKIIIATIISLLMIYLVYAGSYLPIRKGQFFISAYSSQPKSLDDFNNIYNQAIDFYSPIGKDEVISSWMGVVLDLLTSSKSPPNRAVADDLIRQSGDRMIPIIKKGSGFLYSQNLYKLGLIYKTGATMFQDQNYLNQAISVLELGLKSSPLRPIFLYNLFELYYYKHDVSGLKATGEVILKYWPQETQVKQVVDSLGK